MDNGYEINPHMQLVPYELLPIKMNLTQAPQQ
jgi:hypothetical protein